MQESGMNCKTRGGDLETNNRVDKEKLAQWD
jgi:hypothetical protein